MRSLIKAEQHKLKLLTQKQVELTLIEPTKTGLSKSILDATGSVRSFLKAQRIHDYETQRQGPEHKIKISALLYTKQEVIKSSASLYRPRTKKGDPRIWFSNLKKIASPNDIIAIIFYDTRFHVFNLTKLDIITLISSDNDHVLKTLISEISRKANEVAEELLGKLIAIAHKGPVPSQVAADTAVGRTLERALGIDMNASKQPDYKGIELKAFRGSKKNRKNLFAQVPDWSLSKFKSSAEILDAFGYSRGNDFKLYCTVSAAKVNSQGLSLRLDTDISQLIEHSDKPSIGDFAVWTLDKLHKRLQEKHRETFWVQAQSLYIDNVEHFQYVLVEHTKKPIVTQFDLLLEQGIITLDHLIKRNSKGKVVEKGPLFKIKPFGLELLFPPSERHPLVVV